MELFEIFCLFIPIFIIIYYYSIFNYNFWKIRGVQGPKPLPFLGNLKDIMLSRQTVADFSKKICEDFPDEPMIGIYLKQTPILIVKDLKLIKDILIKDFYIFADRGFPIFDKVYPLTQNLVNLEPKRWRLLRKKLSPVFTFGKLKEMFYLLEKSSIHLENYMKKIVLRNELIECRELSSKFTADVIGSCVFGIDTHALSDEKNEFIRIGKKTFDASWRRMVRVMLKYLNLKLFAFFGPLFADKEVDNFFINLISNTIAYRKENMIVRHDFIDLIRFMKDNPLTIEDIELTDTLIAAQAYSFFVAGLETSSTTMSNTLYELALNPLVQDKLQEEIREVLKKSEGKLTYDGVKSMKYLHKVFQETLRKYPPVTMLDRKSLEEYTFSGTNIKIPKGMKIWIPVYAIQRDPKHYPDPEKFDPDRFEEGTLKFGKSMNFLAFGEGPRNCIGARFAVFQTKVGLIKIFQNYRVSKCDKTRIPYVNNPGAFFLAPIGDIHLKFSKID